MQTRLISQPFTSAGIHQTLGDILVDLFTSRAPFYKKIWVVTAFANERAVSRLSPFITASLEDGAMVKITVGIDHQGTSLEALQKILALQVDANVVYNPRPGHTFHPKIYLFEAKDERAELIVGSNNLTEGGLYTNYEAAIWTSFDLKEDHWVYEEIRHSLHKFIEPSGPTVQLLTKELIDNLAEGEIVISEEVRKIIKRDNLEALKSGQPEIAPKKQRPALPFSSESIPTPPRLRIKREIKQPVKKIVYPPSSPDVEMRLVWRKEDLPPSDVQIPTEKTTNVTGGLRLTQANWEVNDQGIDQTTYFRYEVFWGLEWTIGIHPPKKRETTIISCKVVILNKDYGVQKFVISHKPSGEAGQRNYTTMLHWGEMGQIIQEQNLVGKTLFLYAPADPEEVLFHIEIK